MPRITIMESSRGKVPSVYVGKTFEVTQTTRRGDELPTVRKNPDGSYARASWDAYEGTTTTGRKVSFTIYHEFKADSPKLFVRREGFGRGTWVHEYELSE